MPLPHDQLKFNPFHDTLERRKNPFFQLELAFPRFTSNLGPTWTERRLPFLS
jgi:hypothetical protein